MESYFKTSIVTEQVPYCHYNVIEEIVLKIHSMHDEFSRKWKRISRMELLNLNKKQVRHVMCKTIDEREVFILDNSFYSTVKDYITELEELTIETDLDFTYETFDLRLRVKQKESIVNKLKYYQVGKDGNGKYAINKCLNDLLGTRIIIDGFDHNCEQFNELCNDMSKFIKIKKTNASKGDYKATHIYFYGESNNYFPWELQIWNPSDTTNNEISHSLHKQEYTKWAEIYKESIEN
ncbi:hypothetical protein [Bacillus sp. mrc49]|uniref:hypothetical protein n=1 Tax=Bacillus sp. mrc49 TaxID=2054913 RepID=UPI000C27486E|nr:hypothetical protein [Bacillus sp. mrc49]PJN91001.1 hypothetical protein CVN76_07375 [Bacillus sp. mrc49]